MTAVYPLIILGHDKIGRVYSFLHLVCVSFSSIQCTPLTTFDSGKGSGFGTKLKDPVVSLFWQW